MQRTITERAQKTRFSVSMGTPEAAPRPSAMQNRSSGSRTNGNNSGNINGNTNGYNNNGYRNREKLWRNRSPSQENRPGRAYAPKLGRLNTALDTTPIRNLNRHVSAKTDTAISSSKIQKLGNGVDCITIGSALHPTCTTHNGTRKILFGTSLGTESLHDCQNTSKGGLWIGQNAFLSRVAPAHPPPNRFTMCKLGQSLIDHYNKAWNDPEAVIAR